MLHGHAAGAPRHGRSGWRLRRGRPLHDRHDPPPRAGGADGGLGAFTRRESRPTRPVRADRRRATRRDRVDATLAPGAASNRTRCRRLVRPRDAWHGSFHAHAGNADARAAGAARRRPRARVRPAVPHVHDPAPPRRARHGGRAGRHAGRGPGRALVSDRLRPERRSDNGDRPHDTNARRPVSTLATEPSVRSQSVLLAIGTVVAACATATKVDMSSVAPSPDRRVGLRAGWMNAAEASWNLRLVSAAPKPAQFTDDTNPGDFAFLNSDVAFTGHYAMQGNFHGLQVWDISQPSHPTLVTLYVCPDAQNDVSVYRNLLFVSGEDFSGRLDCGAQGVQDSVSKDRMRGIRLFDISDIAHPRAITSVQTCRGSHTHTLVTDPRDSANVYIYVSGTAPVRSPTELPGCSDLAPDKDPNSERFRIEVIQVPLARPEQAHVVSKPAILADLAAPESHGEAPEDIAAAAKTAAEARAKGAFTATVHGMDYVLPPRFIRMQLDSLVKARGGTGAPTGADSATLRAAVQGIVDRIVNPPPGSGPRPGPVQCHDITVYPVLGIAGGACAGYGSLIPVPGRDIMVQGWYQGGISVFDWTDPAHPKEIAYFDRGPMDSTKLVGAGSWSAYWYNGYIYSSEIGRGLDVLELVPSGLLSQNEIDAAKLVHFAFLNVQDQPKLTWPASFVVARAYLDQLARSNGLAPDKVAAARSVLARAERLSGPQRRDALTQLATQLNGDSRGAADQAKVRTLAAAGIDLANAERPAASSSSLPCPRRLRSWCCGCCHAARCRC